MYSENIKEYRLKLLKINKILNILLFIDFEFLKEYKHCM